jgi:hypothetical protein
MANKKITDLTELTEAASDDYLEIVDTSANASKKITRDNLSGWHFLTSPLTSTAWDGDSFSTTAKTKIDLSVVFGVPAGVKAVLVRLAARDSASYANAGLYISLSPTDAAGGAAILRPAGIVNDVYTDGMFIVPCDANGDVYYQIAASGTGTLDAIIEIWGYWL